MHIDKFLTRTASRGIAALACLTCVSAYGVNVKVTFENLNPDNGIWNTPVFFGFHDGGFDSFDEGGYASASIEDLAENGNPGGLVTDIMAYDPSAKFNVLLADDTAMGPPAALFNPGASNSFGISLDSSDNRFLSFASMLLPTNDAFIGNDDAMAYELFDMYGNFSDLTVNVFGADVWDSGTEQNDGMGVPLLNQGPGNLGTSTNDTIASHVGLDFPLFDLGTFPNGIILATGDIFDNSFDVNDYSNAPLARIKVEQVPDSTAYIGILSGLALLGFQLVTRKRMRK